MNPRHALLALVVITTLGMTLGGCNSGGTPTSVDSSLDTTPPTAPTSLAVTTNHATNRSTLSWDASSASDLSGYEVWVDASGTGTYTLAGQVGSSSFMLPVVSSVVDYDYRVRAFDQTGNRSAYSSTVPVQLRPWQNSGDPGDPGAGRMDP